ncbi:hypothetical protein HPL003_09420 [Paenibacillus terrae HPL-003]|uniref:Uncharacterized protein n=1 Tax=Paenibacillus terrae (strain HPL-003) TaxID=985665 RepID=G7W1U6_PAETH|nr:hypothetical protein HPL003_09420 [Paenibacillus terrae HPL-003]
MVCFKTIYRWLYTGCLVKGMSTVLRHTKDRIGINRSKGCTVQVQIGAK